MIISYHGQKINLHRTEYPAWKMSSRKDKRIRKEKFAKLEREEAIRFMEIEGNMVCVRNLDFEARLRKTKQQ